MQSIRDLVLQHVKLRGPVLPILVTESENVLKRFSRPMCSSSASQDQIINKVISLVTKYGKADASKVTETADFQKDLSLDSLDRVELVMAIEEEFSIEIPDEEADKLKSCADVARHIIAQTKPKLTGS